MTRSVPRMMRTPFASPSTAKDSAAGPDPLSGTATTLVSWPDASVLGLLVWTGGADVFTSAFCVAASVLAAPVVDGSVRCVAAEVSLEPVGIASFLKGQGVGAIVVF